MDQTERKLDYHIFLIGFMGAGKSTVALALKDRLQAEMVEMDQMIEKEQGMSIAEMFAAYGEAYFRDIESQTLIQLQEKKGAVISCGGGVVTRRENIDHMKANGRIVLLTALPETIYERVKDSKERPILNQNMSVDFIKSLLEKRSALYEAAADLTIATDQKSIEEICEEIIEGLQSARKG